MECLWLLTGKGKASWKPVSFLMQMSFTNSGQTLKTSVLLRWYAGVYAKKNPIPNLKIHRHKTIL